MTRPDIVQSALGDEGVAAHVDLGDGALFVTPTRTIRYRADKLLSDESVEEFPHGAERVDVSAGRRKATITLDYGLDGERSFTVPAKALDRALHPVLAGTLNAADVTEPGETVMETFRFSELTLVVTSDRVVKHIGSAVWDQEFEEFHYDDVTDISFEEGSVATTLVLTHDGRQERFKAPNERARELRERLTEAVLDHHGVDSLDALRERFDVDEDEPSRATMSFGEGPTPLSVSSDERADEAEPTTTTPDAVGDASDAGTSTPTGGDTDASDSTAVSSTVPTEPSPETETTASADELNSTDGAEANESERVDRSAGIDQIGTDDLLGPLTDAADETAVRSPAEADDGTGDTADLAELAAEIEALRESVEAQNERIARQEELIERLIAELRNRL